jgi:hypothetical protein
MAYVQGRRVRREIRLAGDQARADSRVRRHAASSITGGKGSGA